ncbi:M24 family metallopeptidase [Planctomicrobium sp. SH661]|uniref:M24 family metallopeptidase n=1 Tax=Planctomicrobium sp. SH661 TaxID=3448124 RepID=UPI003F5B02DC
MSATALAPNSPMSSAEIPQVDLQRLEEVNKRKELLCEYLKIKGFDSLLIQDPANFAWLTCGGDNTRKGNSPPVAAALITQEARVILCSNVDSGQIFDRDLMGLGFLLKERPWTEDLTILRQDVCRGRKTAADTWFPGTENVSSDLTPFRVQYGERERERFKALGKDVVHAVEATARNFEVGSTESEVAGHLAHRLIKHNIQPVQLQVMADAQGWRYRRWSYGEDRIERQCIISAIGRRHGLHVGVTRSVCLGAPSAELQQVHRLASVVQATGLFFTQDGWKMEETWKRVSRIYEKFGVPDEWRCAEQADVIGYHVSETSLRPNSQHTFREGTAVYWHPSVRSSLVGDTILVGSGNSEVITPCQNWPVISVQVKGQTIERPSILIREVALGRID